MPAVALIALLLVSFARFLVGAARIAVPRVFLLDAVVAVGVALALPFAFNILRVFSSSLEALLVFISLSLLLPLLLYFRFLEPRLEVFSGIADSASIYIS